MKKLLLYTALYASVQIASAQYCGNSGTTQCIANGTVLQPGLSPMSDSLPPFENNVASTTVIQFRNFNNVFFGGSSFTLSSLRIDTIDNLPQGLCWAADNPTNTYVNSENGCIKVNGVPCDSTGQYKLRIIATATTSAPFVLTAQVDAASVGLHYYVRLINTGDAVVQVDTLTSIPFVPYNGVCQILAPPAVNLGTDSTVCYGTQLSLSSSITGGVQPHVLSWQSIGDSLSCTGCQNPQVRLTQNSTFILTVTDANSVIAKDTVNYTVTGGGGNFQINTNGPTAICRGTALTLHAPHNTSFTNQWKRNGVALQGETDSLYVVTDSSGAYSVTYSGLGCNINSNTVAVTVNAVPSVSVSPTGPVDICVGTSVTLQSTSTSGVTYLWQLGGNNLNGATNPSYTVSLAGSYRVIVKTNANCSDTSNTVVVTVSVCSGINDVEAENAVLIYPNPTHDKLSIQSDLFNSDNIALSLFDVAGKEYTVNYKLQNKVITLSTASLASGIYTVKLHFSGTGITRKFIKED